MALASFFTVCGDARALQHSGSSDVVVQLSYGAGELTLAVRDHGAGIDEAVSNAGQRERHWGLPGMRERAARIGARPSTAPPAPAHLWW